MENLKTCLSSQRISFVTTLMLRASRKHRWRPKKRRPLFLIVMTCVSDPVGTGLIASLARPGTNVTGTSSMTAEVVGK